MKTRHRMRWMPALILCLSAAASVCAQKVSLKPGVYAKFETSMGNFIVELYAQQAPRTVANFTELAEGRKPWRMMAGLPMQTGPLYDGLVFHRVVKGQYVLGGDPAGSGLGDVGFTIPLETSPDLKHDRPGRVAMERKADNPDSAGSMFYITLAPLPERDKAPGYAVFGQVIHGMEVVKAMDAVPLRADSAERPEKPIVIRKVSILRVPKDKELTVDLAATTAAPPAPAAAPAAPPAQESVYNLMKAMQPPAPKAP